MLHILSTLFFLYHEKYVPSSFVWISWASILYPLILYIQNHPEKYQISWMLMLHFVQAIYSTWLLLFQTFFAKKLSYILLFANGLSFSWFYSKWTLISPCVSGFVTYVIPSFLKTIFWPFS